MNTSDYTTVVPAYGADYKTSEEALEAWRSGKDFKIQDISHPYDGSYCSNRDLNAVLIRYKLLEETVLNSA